MDELLLKGLQRLNLNENEIMLLKTLSEKLTRDGSLSARHLEGITFILQDAVKKRIGGDVRLGSEKTLFKAILGEMISLDYEDMEPKEILEITMGAVRSFTTQHNLVFHFDIPCQTCGGMGEVSTDESDGEGHIQSGVGTAPCPECRPARDEDDSDDQG